MKHVSGVFTPSGLAIVHKLRAGLLLCITVAAAAAMAHLDIQTVVDDMTRPHEGRPQDAWKKFDWGKAPLIRKGTKIPSDWSEPCFIPWGAVFLEDGTTPSSSIRVQIRNVKGYIYSKSRKKWELTHSDGFGGGWYKTDYTTGRGGTQRNESNADGGGVSVTLASHNIYHFWGSGRVPFDRNDLGGVFTCVEFRLIGNGDMSKARYLVHMGGDYYRSTTWKFDPDNPDWNGVGGAAVGRFRFATARWQTVCMHTMTAEQIRANPPPPVGETPQPDTTPPSAPAGLSAGTASSSQIDLSWSKASDPESGIATYIIFRNGTKIGTSGKTSYSDKGLDEGAAYTYRVSAVNGEGLEGDKSNEAAAATDKDITAPKLASVIAPSETSVTVVFSEPITKESAGKGENYSISDGIAISSVSLDNADNISATLTVSTLALKKTYTLTVTNISDQASTPNTGGDQQQFSYSGELHMTGLTVASGGSYERVQSIADGDLQYIDREFTFSSLGDFAGMHCIRTANGDKSRSGDRFLSFTVNRRITAYVAYDKRVSKAPSWLSSWDKKGQRESISEAYPDGIIVYSRDFNAGTVSLGANGATEYESMYSVFVEAAEDETTTSHTGPKQTIHPGPVQTALSGRTLRITGLNPEQAYTVTVADVRGRIAATRQTSGADGTIALSAANRPGGVYVVSVRSKGHGHTASAVVP